MRHFVLAALATACALPISAQDATEPAPKPVSVLVRPLWLGAEPPASRSARNIHIGWAGARGVPAEVTRSKEEAEALAWHVRSLLAAGSDFEQLAIEHSDARNAKKGAVLGTFQRGTLLPAMEAFLFGAELGAVSDPILSGNGYHVLQRVDWQAGCAQILVEGLTSESLNEARALVARLRAGEDFAELARAHSDHPESAERGGLFRVVERTALDRYVRAAAFRLPVGGISDPVESPLGYHVVKRLPLDAFPAELVESNWIRARAILISHAEIPGRPKLSQRSRAEAEKLARELHQRIRQGEARLEALAAEHTDDPTGRSRGGDLGWLYRQNYGMARGLDPLFHAEPGELLAPFQLPTGWVVARRER
jgi:parvulin-like peptidyl-prolyl isomerase